MMKIINNILFKTRALSFGFFIALGFVIFSCEKVELTANEIVKNSVEAHGGVEAWNAITQLSFDKETTLFNEDGSIEIRTNQFQLFKLKPTLFGKIEWESSGDDVAIIYDNNKVSKTINDSIILSDEELEKAKSSFFAAQYVIVQPFALLDEGVELTLKGQTELDGKTAYEVAVKYAHDTENSNKWSYYIDAESFIVVANKVELLDHTSWVENLTFDTTSDFKFNAHRKSYRLNEDGEKTYLRAEYFYSNFSVLSE